MEEVFEKLKKEGKNDVDSIVKWLEDSKLVESTVEGKEKAKAYFKDVADKQNVNLDNFKQAIGKVATEKKKSLEEVTQMLSEQGQTFMGAVRAGVSAFQDAMKEKEKPK